MILDGRRVPHEPLHGLSTLFKLQPMEGSHVYLVYTSEIPSLGRYCPGMLTDFTQPGAGIPKCIPFFLNICTKNYGLVVEESWVNDRTFLYLQKAFSSITNFQIKKEGSNHRSCERPGGSVEQLPIRVDNTDQCSDGISICS